MNSDISLCLGNMLYEGRVADAITLGELSLRKKQDAGVHCMLMQAYFKLRNEDATYISKSTEHAKLAIVLGHDTGYCHERLLKNLRELGQLNKAMQLCDMIIAPDFEFGKNGCGNKAYYVKARMTLLKQIMRGKAKDEEADVLFTQQQIANIKRLTNDAKRRELEKQKIWDKIQLAWENGNSAEYDKLMKIYHKF